MRCDTARFLKSVVVVVRLEASVGVFLTRRCQVVSISIFDLIIGSFAMDIELERVARWRVSDPMNTWPEHRRGHRITLLGNPLFDYECLRCWLERVATEKAKEDEIST